MKKFLAEIVMFLTLACSLLMIITYTTDKGLQRSNHRYYQSWNDIYHGAVNAGVLIQGNSHAWVQVDPAIIDSAMHMSSYNLGLNAYLFDIQYARYKFYRAHNLKPRLIVQCIDLFTFDKSGELIDKPQFLPYLSDSSIASATEKTGMPQWYRYLPFLKYQEQATLVNIGVQRFWQPIRQDTERLYKGYRGEERQWDEGMFNWLMEQNPHYIPEINGRVFNQFKTFLAGCEKDTIQVVMVLTPHYHRFTETVVMLPEYRQLMRLTANKYGATFLDFTTDSLCMDSTKFYNATHLNKTGAEIFSGKLAAELVKEGKKRNVKGEK